MYLLLEKMIEFNFLQAFRIRLYLSKFRTDSLFIERFEFFDGIFLILNFGKILLSMTMIACVFWNLFSLTFRMDDGISFVTIRLNFLLLSLKKRKDRSKRFGIEQRLRKAENNAQCILFCVKMAEFILSARLESVLQRVSFKIPHHRRSLTKMERFFS